MAISCLVVVFLYNQIDEVDTLPKEVYSSISILMQLHREGLVPTTLSHLISRPWQSQRLLYKHNRH